MGKNTEKLGKKKETNHSFSGTMYSVFPIPLWLFQHQTHHLEKRFFFFFFLLICLFCFSPLFHLAQCSLHKRPLHKQNEQVN